MAALPVVFAANQDVFNKYIKTLLPTKQLFEEHIEYYLVCRFDTPGKVKMFKDKRSNTFNNEMVVIQFKKVNDELFKELKRRFYHQEEVIFKSNRNYKSLYDTMMKSMNEEETVEHKKFGWVAYWTTYDDGDDYDGRIDELYNDVVELYDPPSIPTDDDELPAFESSQSLICDIDDECDEDPQPYVD